MLACRICYEVEGPGNPLLSPCICAGTMAHIHSQCLLKWTRMKPDSPDVCELCKTIYVAPWKRRVAVLEDVTLPLGILLFHPIMLLWGWMNCHGWILVQEWALFRDVQDIFTIYSGAHLVVSVYKGIPYGVVCISTLYAVCMARAFHAVKHKARYVHLLLMTTFGNRYVSFSPFFCSLLCLMGLVGSFFHPLPGALLFTSMIGKLPETHRAILMALNQELITGPVWAQEDEEDDEEEDDEEAGEVEGEVVGEDEEIRVPE